MRIDSLRHLAVIDPDTACRTGTVTDYWLDVTAGRLAALVQRPVDVDQAQRVSCARVGHIGHDAVMLTPASGQAVFSLEPIPEDWLDRRHLKQLTVYSDDGDRLGRVAQAHIDPVTLNIQSYELAVPFWRRWLPARRQVPGDLIAWCGRDVLVVRTDQPAKLRPVGREDGSYVQPAAELLPSKAKAVSRNGSVAV
jgi:uncharacterized protein YrrD